ncbi:MAG: zinc ribbon domain-containing protein [Candidatus Riflebacteria bacterium]|nr:zinc ribbon domain-containing protein [Candidatus Riflebacteria bacterium]
MFRQKLAGVRWEGGLRRVTPDGRQFSPAPWRCPVCGKPSPASSQFCGSCGRPASMAAIYALPGKPKEPPKEERTKNFFTEEQKLEIFQSLAKKYRGTEEQSSVAKSGQSDGGILQTNSKNIDLPSSNLSELPEKSSELAKTEKLEKSEENESSAKITIAEASLSESKQSVPEVLNKIKDSDSKTSLLESNLEAASDDAKVVSSAAKTDVLACVKTDLAEADRTDAKPIAAANSISDATKNTVPAGRLEVVPVALDGNVESVSTDGSDLQKNLVSKVKSKKAAKIKTHHSKAKVSTDATSGVKKINSVDIKPEALPNIKPDDAFSSIARNFTRAASEKAEENPFNSELLLVSNEVSSAKSEEIADNTDYSKNSQKQSETSENVNVSVFENDLLLQKDSSKCQLSDSVLSETEIQEDSEIPQKHKVSEVTNRVGNIFFVDFASPGNDLPAELLEENPLEENLLEEIPQEEIHQEEILLEENLPEEIKAEPASTPKKERLRRHKHVSLKKELGVSSVNLAEKRLRLTSLVGKSLIMPVLGLMQMAMISVASPFVIFQKPVEKVSRGVMSSSVSVPEKLASWSDLRTRLAIKLGLTPTEADELAKQAIGKTPGPNETIFRKDLNQIRAYLSGIEGLPAGIIPVLEGKGPVLLAQINHEKPRKLQKSFLDVSLNHPVYSVWKNLIEVGLNLGGKDNLARPLDKINWFEWRSIAENISEMFKESVSREIPIPSKFKYGEMSREEVIKEFQTFFAHLPMKKASEKEKVTLTSNSRLDALYLLNSYFDGE